MRKRQNTTNLRGTWFAMKLTKREALAGLVVRHYDDCIVLAYIFGPKFVRMPTPDFLATLKRKDAITCLYIFDDELKEGGWPAIGNSITIHPQKWPIPYFWTQNPLTDQLFRVRPSEESSDDFQEQKPIRKISPSLHDYGMFSTPAAVYRVKQLLKQKL
jgi:hypothetical protein